MSKYQAKISRDEIIQILSATDPKDLLQIFNRARGCRKASTGDTIFAYGFIYFTTWCQNDCKFCFYRQSNNIDRYRKTEEEILEIANKLGASGVSVIDLTMGEDPYYHKDGFAQLLSVVEQIKKNTNLSVMVSPGLVEDKIIDRFVQLGADWYALYQETHNKNLFEGLRTNQSYDMRIHAKEYAVKKGMLIEEGIMTGIGETIEDIADSIIEMGNLHARQMRVMSFIPQSGSPMEGCSTPDRLVELKTIAAMRIAYPWTLIPASLDVDGINGLKDRINAGCNVVTSIIPPNSGLAGVAHEKMDVDNGGRTVEEVANILRTMQLSIGTPEEYRLYLEGLQ